MSDFIVAGIIFGIVGAALLYIRKEKKQGVQCIGCPHAQACARRKKCNCNH